ncbi:putative disease resistance protein at3g14460 [Phtheirospermum japonicum]|uniref:Putative disease resistance protein at3g14460 n=1 Tax=Phtheirospermum japonicum TaxID=374723 RepID=A0A830BEV5_9LAMI|nr:putative disease resistance protein at3g14460 [Phtheirospermum japonicum]
MERPEDIILAALANENPSIIGIYGFPGIIGTRLATRVGEKAMKHKLISGVLLATDELQSRLMMEKGILIIVDQVPETFYFGTLRKPFGKIIITSQFKTVFSGMGATKIFTAATAQQELEIWTLAKPEPSRGLLDLDRILKGSIHLHPELSRQVVGGTQGVISQHDMIGKGFCLSPRQSTIIERVAASPPESNCLKSGEESRDENVPAGRLSVGTKANEVQKLETFPEAMLEVLKDMALHREICFTECILFCSLLPREHRFTKDMLVWQWIALRLIELEEDEIMEEVCSRCFDTLLTMEYIVAAGYDHAIDQPKYKLGDKMIVFIRNQLSEHKFKKNMDSVTDVTKVEHLSLDFKEVDLIDFGVLKSYAHLQTLIIYCSRVRHLPPDLFLELKGLKILNLSHSDIQSLPISIENLKELRFLDVSETPLMFLPDVICCLSHLQTLKLDGSRIRKLPQSTSELVNLRHLVIDVVTMLGLMPKEIGKLTKLQTLSAFLVGDHDGYRIGELKCLDKLKGSLKIWNLEIVKTKEEAAEACLSNKKDLQKVELRWRYPLEEKNSDEEEILEYLQPPSGIQKLKISMYNGGVFPSWISSPLLSELVTVTLYSCTFCDTLPSLGVLPSLNHLEIIGNGEVIEIGSLFCRKQPENHQVAFPKLEKLKLVSMSKLERWTGVVNGDFPCLNCLIIDDCPKLVGLPFLSHLRSLARMQIMSCRKLSCFPEGGLPPALENLNISDCPKLEDRCCNEQCEDWSKVAHVRDFYIDFEKLLHKANRMCVMSISLRGQLISKRRLMPTEYGMKRVVVSCKLRIVEFQETTKMPH